MGGEGARGAGTAAGAAASRPRNTEPSTDMLVSVRVTYSAVWRPGRTAGMDAPCTPPTRLRDGRAARTRPRRQLPGIGATATGACLHRRATEIANRM